MSSPITIQDFMRARDKIINRPYTPPDRIVSFEASLVLDKIHELEPTWNSWTVSTEIYLKASRLGIIGGLE